MKPNEHPPSDDSYEKISFSLPRALLEKIDSAAKADFRTRSSWLVSKLSSIVDGKSLSHEPLKVVEQKKVVLQKKA